MAVFSGVRVDELSCVRYEECVSTAGLCVFGVNGECMVRGVIGGRSESRPRVPGVSIKFS